ncbi:hypothetical protein RMSM_06413 [Rhodopirellula maiorica SM1]|uniref:Uncharacterized protein n=1 Tax=Rhodopirellula maiorica SM1 TaxID=1265738 RepID=M5RRT6_9BACT|nr:hypothetical protein RMSM_06413 [Rhodopirellula maiorica SM1]
MLTPDRTDCAEEVNDAVVPFAEKMEGLPRESATGYHESETLQAAFRKNMQQPCKFCRTQTQESWLSFPPTQFVIKTT